MRSSTAPIRHRMTGTGGRRGASLALVAAGCCGCCLSLRRSVHPASTGQKTSSALQIAVLPAVAKCDHFCAIWHDACTEWGMKQPRRGSAMSSRLLRRKGFTGAGQREGTIGVREGDHGSGPGGEWSLSSHSPGQEPWSLGFEELARLRREAGDADGLDGELN